MSSQNTGTVPTGTLTTVKDNRTVAQLLLDYLELEGATTVFGVPGGALISVMDELKRRRQTFNFVICRQETGAGYIAHGYAVVTGRLGVVFTTSGPSATNAVTAAMNAQSANCAVLTITGEIPQQFSGQGYLQEGVDSRLDVSFIYRNAVEYSAIISNESNFTTLFTQALRSARSLPNRAAHISLPNNVAASCMTGNDKAHPYRIPFPTSPSAYRTLASGTDVERVRLTFDDLVASTRPLLFLGNGARVALRDPQRMQRFMQLVERYALPVMTTPDGKGIFPESHPMSLRNFGMTACQWPELYMLPVDDPAHFDTMVVLGSNLGELATSDAATDQYSRTLIPTTNFVQVDLDQSVIGREFPVTRGIVGEVGATIDALCDIASRHEPDLPSAEARRQLVAAITGGHSPYANPEYRASQASPINPAALVRVINETVTDGHVFIDAGNCVGWSLHYMVIDPPVQYHSALGMGPMGFGVGAVIGGKLGAPDKVCVAVVGDGAFMMHGAEVSTAAQQGIGAIIVVLYDNDLAMVSQGMADLFPGDRPWTQYYQLGAPDLVKVAEGFGADAVAIMTSQGPADFAVALRTAIHQADANKRPQVIVAHIDTAPMPPYGWPTIPAPPCAPPAASTRASVENAQ
jgi:acetolactate synthase-1/2/3 large subunit